MSKVNNDAMVQCDKVNAHAAWRSNFDDRQNKEIDFCLLYRNEFNHGTDGHILRTIIADMATILSS